ncbi:replication protein A 32 kDa subunit-B-like [Lytechinus pictus]|uniref:replication protein A 32 kDa subunit-B-like n=1 Tax=Lytechinus pictus TaxID=7653 RepID=UPI0030BA2504
MFNNQGGFDGYGNDHGGMGGGGFNSPGGFNTPGGFNSPGVGSSQTKAKRAQKIIPCNIAQIMQATQNENDFKIGDVEIHQVCIVAVIRKAEMSATNIVYEVDDMSGPVMEIRQWIDSDESSMDQQPTVHEENTYIKVSGNVRAFGGKRSIGPFRIAPISDLNQITMHMAEVVQAHMLLSKMANAQNGNISGGSMNQNQYRTPVKGGMMGGDMMGGGMMAPNNGLNNVQTQIHQLITSCHDEEGISMDYLSTQLKGISRDSIRKAVEFLSSEGHIYSTIDDDHFKSTES